MGNFAEIATLTADPELRFTPSGKAVCELRFAVNTGYKNSAGQGVDNETTWIDGTLWNGAENAAESLRKGTRVLVIGDMRTRSWQAEDGTNRSKLYLEVAEIGASTRFATVAVTKNQKKSA